MKHNLMITSYPITLKDFRSFTRGIPINTPLGIEPRFGNIVTKLYYDGKKIIIGKK